MLRHRNSLLLLAWSAGWLAVWAPSATAYLTVPSGFVVENAVPGAAFDTPTSMAFLPDGRMLVGLKEGTVWLVQNGGKLPGPALDLRRVVLNQADRGLLDVAVDPNFNANRHLYFIYVVDPDSNMVDTNDDAYSRLVRYQLPIGSNIVDTTTRAVLFGRNWAEGPPCGSESHTVGSLRWGADGSLIVSHGDGAQFDGVDEGGDDPGLFLPGRTNPVENIGAYRAQYVGSLAGKILRLDPATGLGYPSNPFYDGNPASVRSRVYAYGLRNPFRLCVRPGTGNADPSQGRPGSIYLGDVGWDTWEELSIATTPGLNFGWPCREGLHTTAYVGAPPPAHSGCSSLGTPNNPATVFTPPVSDWHHFTASLSSPSGVTGNAASGSVFYEGTLYPAAYQGRYFFADFGQSWIRAATVDANDNIISYALFGDDVDDPVDLVSDPVSKDIHYISISTGQVRRIRYFGSPNGTPVAQASAAPLSGGIPLSVAFSSAGSSDPNGDPLEYIWDFGDGSGSLEPNPTHVYTTSGAFAPTLTVSDLHGGYNTKALQVTVGDQGGFPSTPVIDNFNRPNGLLAAPWGNTSGAAIASNQLRATTSSSSPIWTGTQFAPDQEAYYTFASAPQGEFHIHLKLQYVGGSASHIEVKYAGNVQITTFDDTGVGWVMRGPPMAVTFNSGDTFGARAYGSTVNVYKNGTLVGTRSIAGWQFVGSPGYVGLAMINNGSGSRLDNFGGGSFVPVVNTAPTAIIANPADNAFYVEAQPINLMGNASDAQTPAAQMGYHWDVALHHNNHSHPGQLVSDNRNDAFLPESHEDGTGTWLEAMLVVTDGGGLKDTASVTLWPEVDLDPSPVTVTPDPARRIDVNQFSFKLRNYGRMMSRRSHWALRAGPTLLAEGDTLVAPLDSLTITVPVDLSLDPGDHPLRVTLDTLAVVRELSETNNAKMRTLTVMDGPVAVDLPLPREASLSAGSPNPTRRTTHFGLALPRSVQVSMDVHDIQGRRVWSSGARPYAAGRWDLTWDAKDQPPGVYLLQIQAGERRWIRRIAVVR
ncbi:MAG TPA: PQQ-dependent sugar dehydrogenase [Candidatus Eisenbacteria bacterium]|nr:PQQ-dependent sugar dehydrogenase [Candidatus Eisenbacteria bacterium]